MDVNKVHKIFNSDKYQYTESSVYLQENMENIIATFDVFVRVKNNEYAIVNGIEEVIDLINILNKSSYDEKKKYLYKIIDDKSLVEYIASTKFEGSIKGVRNGEIVFTNEPILTITAPIIVAKILETPILNVLHYCITTATTAHKIINASKNKDVLFFGSRRASGFDGMILSSKSSYIVGDKGQSNIMFDYYYNKKSVGTMSHSYIQSFGMSSEGEYEAFDLFIKNNKKPKNPLIMLIDSYDSLGIGIKNAIKAFKNNRIDDNYEGIYGIRIDSGNLLENSIKCRKLLIENGLNKAKIVLTGGLNEKKIKDIIEKKGEVDIFGVGDAISIGENVVSTVYKMSKINDNDVMKISNDIEKTSYPGNKKIYKINENDEYYHVVTLEDEKIENIKEENYINKEAIIEKITLDYIKNGEFIEKNIEKLTLEKSREYFSKNKVNIEKIKKEKIIFSKKLEKLKKKLIEMIKNNKY